MVLLETPPLDALEDFEEAVQACMKVMRALNGCPGFWKSLEDSKVPEQACGGLKWWESTLDHMGVVVGRFKELEAVSEATQRVMVNGGA